MILINCKKKILGRISSVISKILINLNFFNKKIFFFVFNCNQMILKKRIVHKHSGYIGNLKKKSLDNITLIKKSIFKMLPKNKKRIKIMKKIYFFEYKI
ncbi:uL13 family ribosomal protein [Candidatus Carsonella ruddii]|uniref:50S ribosomal protein L13 n=1 Tax=Carsonella ruddii TaxID=114186 RepID=A0AAE7KLJ1_CARRU|nr:uL13 family ribosomal protein [Candidatus Carsonella ruddii]QLK14027.1 hypothetical protein FK493_00295 [Candidatus Carsonella ruddii]